MEPPRRRDGGEGRRRREFESLRGRDECGGIVDLNEGTELIEREECEFDYEGKILSSYPICHAYHIHPRSWRCWCNTIVRDEGKKQM